MADNSLAQASRAALNGGADPNSIDCGRQYAGGVFRNLDPAQRSVNDDFCAIAFLIGVMEKLRDDDAVCVGHEHPGIRYAIEKAVSWLDLSVQNTVVANDLRIQIGQQWEGYPLLLGEFGERLLIVIGNCVNFDSRSLESVKRIAQLPELRPAGRSPNGGPVEHYCGASCAPVLMEPDDTSARIRKNEIRQSLPQRWASRMTIRQPAADWMTKRDRRIEAVFVAVQTFDAIVCHRLFNPF